MYFYDVEGTVCASVNPCEGLREADGTDAASRACVFLFSRDRKTSRASFCANHEDLLAQTREGAFWLSRALLAEGVSSSHEKNALSADPAFPALREKAAAGQLLAVNTAFPDWERRVLRERRPQLPAGKKKTVHLLAVGDVGSGVVTGLHLLGGDVIDHIGIYDVAEKNVARWEFEINQIALPWEYEAMPEVVALTKEALFDCDVFLFTASAGIPPVDSGIKDVRMYQFEKNAKIIAEYARMAREADFKGLFCAVSDPVDPLAKAAYLASNTDENGVFDGKGLLPEQIQSYGLGVMNARAAYYAKRNPKFARFLNEGRAYGPHGQELVIADSLDGYDDAVSKELTELVVTANLKMRELGFKPYVAPAYSSAALSVLLTLRGEWHYGGVFFGGIYMGCKNRYTPYGQTHEIADLPAELFARIRHAEETLHGVN